MIVQKLLRHQYLFFSFIFLLLIINEFLGNSDLEYIIGIMSIFMLTISFFNATLLFKILGGVFLTVGGFLFLLSDLTIVEIPPLLTSNLLLLALLSMLPWMNSVVRSGGFDKSLSDIIKVNASDLGKLYPRSLFASFIMVAFLNLPAAIITQDLLKNILNPLDKKLRNSFITSSNLRGFSLAVMWSPLEIMVAVSIFATGVNYIALLPWLLVISFTTFLIDSIWGRFYFKKHLYTKVDSHGEQAIIPELNMRDLFIKIVYLLVSLTIFLALVITLGNIFNLSFILTVILLIFPFSLVWAIFMKRLKRFWIIGKNTWIEKTNSMQNFIILFISLSFFSNSLNATSFIDIIEKPIALASSYPLAVLFLIQVLFVFLSMFGIHPIATVGILTSVIIPLSAVMNPVSIAIVLVSGSAATMTVGTYGLLVTLTSISTQQNPYRITLTNLPFALLMAIVSTVVAYIIV